MNERIREPYLQAVEYSNSQMTFSDTREYFAEKFAELIVRECAEVINDGVLNNDGSGDWVNGYNAGATECLRKIKQHFGVF